MQHYKNCVEGIPPHLIPDRPYTKAQIHIYVAKVLCVHKDICVVVLMLRNSLYIIRIYGENVNVSCNICFDNTLIVFGIIFERLMRGKAYVEYFCVAQHMCRLT